MSVVGSPVIDRFFRRFHVIINVDKPGESRNGGQTISLS